MTTNRQFEKDSVMLSFLFLRLCNAYNYDSDAIKANAVHHYETVVHHRVC